LCNTVFHSVPDKYVHFDLDGELEHCTKVVELFHQAGYAVELTAPDSSHQNGPGECPHCRGTTSYAWMSCPKAKILALCF